MTANGRKEKCDGHKCRSGAAEKLPKSEEEDNLKGKEVE
jgi:hypothetical protein